MLDEMRRNAPKRTYQLASAIGTKNAKYGAGVFAGVLNKKKINFGGAVGKETIYGQANLARLIEFGFRAISWPDKGQKIDEAIKAGKEITDVEAKPFVEPAIKRYKDKVPDEAVKIMKKSLERYKKRYNIN